MFVITRVRYKESLLQYKIILVNHFQECSTIRYTHIVRYREVRYREVSLYNYEVQALANVVEALRTTPC